MYDLYVLMFAFWKHRIKECSFYRITEIQKLWNYLGMYIYRHICIYASKGANTSEHKAYWLSCLHVGIIVFFMISLVCFFLILV